MKNILSTAFSLLISVSLLAQATFNDANAEMRNVKGFRGIKVATGIQLVLTQGSTEAVAVSAPTPEDRNRIKTVVENGVLKIYYDYDAWKLLRGKINKKLRAYVSVVNIDEMAVSSGASLKVDGEIKTDKLGIKASSGGILEGKIVANDVNVDQSSGAVVRLSGSADNMDIEGSSGSVFHGYDVAVNSCNAKTSSGAGVQVTVNKEISAGASSGGSVIYKGDGTLKNKRTSSGGHVGRKG